MDEKEADKPEEGASPSDTAAEPPEPVRSAGTAKREDQIQNAVAFLSHPKVRTSTIESKRSFLQKKGLTEAEIDDAFKRVPDSSDTTVGPPSTTSQLADVSRPQKPFPTATNSGPYQPYQAQGALEQTQQALQPTGYRWSQVALGTGLVAVTAWGIKSLVVPQAVRWYRSWTGQPHDALAKHQEQSETAKILAEAIKAQTAELRASVDSMKEMLNSFEAKHNAADRQNHSGLSLADLRQELKSFAGTTQLHSSAASAQQAVPDNLQQTLTDISRTLAQLSAPRSTQMTHGVIADNSPAGRSGEGSSVSRQLPFASGYNGKGQGHGNSPSAAPSSRNSPASHRESSNSPTIAHPQSRSSPFAADRNSPFVDDSEPPGSIQTSPGEPPHPASYMEVLEMLENGQTPPGIRTDINDKPPNPEQAIPGGHMKPRPKPWERSTQNGTPAFAAGNTGPATSTVGSSGAVGHQTGVNGSSIHRDENTPGHQQQNGVVITEVAATPSAGNSPTGSSTAAPWKPPAIPQSSINLGKRTKSEASSTA